jgi:hypothetical protein
VISLFEEPDGVSYVVFYVATNLTLVPVGYVSVLTIILAGYVTVTPE